MSKSNQQIRDAVRENYAAVAESSPDVKSSSGCCNGVNANADQVSMGMGYSEADVKDIPDGANMGLGCGNPKAIAALKKDEVVLDLGSGGGFDCFLAAREVGEKGNVIGVDMTHEMISKSRKNAEKFPLKNVEFRLGEIENLPVADNSVDVIISNCVINLSTDKQRVFDEAFRVLKPGGRLAISDIVTSIELPKEIEEDIKLYTACVAGASSVDALTKMLNQSGFNDIKIQPKDESKAFIKTWSSKMNAADYIVSASIEAVKGTSRN